MANWAFEIAAGYGLSSQSSFFKRMTFEACNELLVPVVLFPLLISPKYRRAFAMSYSNPRSSSLVSTSFPIPSKQKKKKKPHLVLQAASTSFNVGEEEEEEEEEIRIAKEVVSNYLEREIGVSTEEAKQIAFNCPKYVTMLVEGVRELDELALSMSMTPNTTDESELSLKAKIYQLVQQKGDKGVVPFLESLGLPLPSASHLARYLSSRSLPHLIHQVNLVKEMLYTGDEGLPGRHARRMMMHLSISVDEDLQQTLSFFEKIQARRGGLDLLGNQHSSFKYLIESFPRLLMLPLETHFKTIGELFESIGVTEQQKSRVFLLFPPIMFYDVERDIQPRLKALRKVGIGDKELAKMLPKYPWILSASILENFMKVFEFLGNEKVPEDSAIVAITKWPHILCSSINKLTLMISQFDDLGVTGKRLGQVISRSPNLLLQRPENFLQVIYFLQDLGLDEQSVIRILFRCPEMFAANLEKTLKRKLDFLSSIGVSRTHLPRVIRKYPEFFVCDIDRALSPRINYLIKVGLSKRDVGFMVRRFSPLLGYSIEDVLKPKVEFLVNVMKKPLNEVVDYPRYFSYSLEKKIKPRYFVLKRNNRDCSLQEMLGKNDEEFAADFMGDNMLAAVSD